jgi:hypothetical protein
MLPFDCAQDKRVKLYTLRHPAQGEEGMALRAGLLFVGPRPHASTSVAEAARSISARYGTAALRLRSG